MASSTTERHAPWLRKAAASFMAGEAHCFILHNDTAGYAVPGVTQVEHLTRAMHAQKRLVAFYDRAQGVTFSNKADRDEAVRLLRDAERRATATKNAPAPAVGNPALAGLAAQMKALSGGAPAGDDGDPFSGTKQPAAAMDVLGRLLTAEADSVAVIIRYADALLPDTQKSYMSPQDRDLLVQLLTWATDAQLAAKGNPIFLLTGRLADLHSDLRASTSGMSVVEMAMPDRAARLAYITWYLDRRAQDIAGGSDEPAITLETGFDAEQLANATAGLSLRHVENILLLGASEGLVTRALVKATKDGIIQSEFSEVAEMLEPLPGGFAALGGMEHFKAWARADAIEAVRAGRFNDVPKGVLLVGPPGTGKTYGVRALATEIGYNAVALRMENVLGGIVGESERKLKTFFGFVKALSPCLVFVDEIDQSDVAARGNSSGNPVASNLFSQMLQFLGDETLRGRVMMVFASNQPNLLDPAMLRFGRMDVIMPILLPDAEARASIIQVQAATQGVSIAPAAVTWLAENGQTRNYSAADLAAVVAKARKLTTRAGRDTITPADAQRALGMIRPATTERADYYTNLAVAACNDTEFLPPELAALLDNREQLEAKIEADAPAQPRGARKGW